MSRSKEDRPLSDLQRAIALHYVGEGRQKSKEVARLTGTTYKYVQKSISLPNVRKRINELFAQAEAKARAIRLKLIQEMAYLATSNIAEIIGIGKDGYVEVRDIKELPVEVQKCIKKFEIINVTSKDGEGKEQRLKIELWDKVRSAELVGRWLNMEKPVSPEDEEKKDNELVFRGIQIVFPNELKPEPKALPEMEDEDAWLQT